MSVNNVSHKELLTFSNLTNLEWEFVNLEAIKKGDNDGTIGGEDKSNSELTTQLNDLLAPENFVREETDPETGKKRTIQVYGEGEQGLFEMRQKAGIAMEYLEKWQEYEETGGARGTDEGSFLQDWEVIYAADNYKAIADYLDYKKKTKKAE